MELSLTSILSELPPDQLEALLKKIDNSDPVAYEKREAYREQVLGLDRASTVYEGRGYKITGVTKWKDTRDGKEYALNSYIETELIGTWKKQKWYWMRMDYNGKKCFGASMHNHVHQKKTKETFFKEMHEMYRNAAFSHLRMELGDDLSFSVDGYFQKEVTEVEARDLRIQQDNEARGY